MEHAEYKNRGFCAKKQWTERKVSFFNIYRNREAPFKKLLTRADMEKDKKS